VNHPGGIELRLSLPLGKTDAACARFAVNINVYGDLKAAIAADGRSFRFSDARGTLTEWGPITVVNERGELLPIELSIRPSSPQGETDRPTCSIGILLPLTPDMRRVTIAGAFLGSAPLRARGLPATPQWTGEGDQEGAQYGYACHTAGDVNGDGFSDIIVGAPRYDHGEEDEGRVYVYLGSARGVSDEPVWTAEGNQNGALFGAACGMAGDVNGDGFSDIIVGATHYDHGETDEGRVYVYLVPVRKCGSGGKGDVLWNHDLLT
jgi:hypothetical protein